LVQSSARRNIALVALYKALGDDGDVHITTALGQRWPPRSSKPGTRSNPSIANMLASGLGDDLTTLVFVGVRWFPPKRLLELAG